MWPETIYKPISWWQIRLLKLLPGLGDDKVEAELLVADVVHNENGGAVLHDLQRYVQYEALSYVWGDPIFGHVIYLNDVEITTTTSLGSALKHLRTEVDYRFIWCDALCIKQDDEVEKTHQIQKMFTIFNKASEVLVWLGEAGPYTSQAIALLSLPEQVGRSAENLFIAAEAWKGVLDLCSRPWTLRLWVQQEVFAARQISVRCGTFVLSFADYQRCAGRARDFIEGDRRFVREETSAGALKSIRALTRMRTSDAAILAELERQRHGTVENHSCYRSCEYGPCESLRYLSMNIECVLHGLVGLQTTLEIDHIYAALGMTNCRVSAREGPVYPSSFPVIEIDYARPVAQVFQDVTRYVIQRCGDLKVVSLLTPGGRDPNGLDLPSWCPDYRSYESHMGSREPVETDVSFEFRIKLDAQTTVGCIQIPGIRLGTFHDSPHLGVAQSHDNTIALRASREKARAYQKLRLRMRTLEPYSTIDELLCWRAFSNDIQLQNLDIVVGSSDLPQGGLGFMEHEGRRQRRLVEIKVVVLRPLPGLRWSYVGQIGLIERPTHGIRAQEKFSWPAWPKENFVVE